MRGPAKQKARMGYRKNRGKLKQRAKLRYKQVRTNPRFKRKKKIYRKNRQRHRRLAFGVVADEQVSLEAAVEFVMKCGGKMKSGYVTGVVADTWQIEYLLEDGEIGSLSPERFFECAVLFEGQDIDVLFDILDEASELEDDGDEDSVTVFEFDSPEGGFTPVGDPSAYFDDKAEGMLANVTNLYLAFNKENPSDLLSQLVKVLDKATKDAEGQGRKGLQDISSRVKGMAKNVAEAWEKRTED